MKTPVGLTQESIIVNKVTAEENRPQKNFIIDAELPISFNPHPINNTPVEGNSLNEPSLPTKFKGTINLNSDRPARDMGKIVDGIIDQLTNIPGAEVNLTLDIHAEIPNGIDKNKERTLVENANSLGFVDKEIT